MIFSWLKYRKSLISRRVRRLGGAILADGPLVSRGKDRGYSQEHYVLSGLDLLDRDLLSGRLVKCRTHHSVCSFSYHILDVILLRHIEGDLSRPSGGWWGAVGHGKVSLCCSLERRFQGEVVREEGVCYSSWAAGSYSSGIGLRRLCSE